MAARRKKYSDEWIDRFLNGETYTDLVELLTIVRTSPGFNSQASDLNLPAFAFVFAETLNWFATACRSGVWTYFEATPTARQNGMRATLKQIGPPMFAEWYERGMCDWEDEDKMVAVSEWMKLTDEAAHAWLRRLMRENRDKLLALF
jgi:hypothetical protein